MKIQFPELSFPLQRESTATELEFAALDLRCSEGDNFEIVGTTKGTTQ